MKTKMIAVAIVCMLFVSGCEGGGGLFGAGGDYTVYVTPSGNKYHSSNCSSIQGSTRMSMSKEKAINAGYGQCQVCRP